MTIANAPTVAARAAQEVAANLPTSAPLTVGGFDAASAPASDAVAVMAHHAGETGADLVIVAGDATAQALADAGAGVAPADILRPALEAAAAVLGPGVLDEARSEPLAGSFSDPDIEVFALVDAAGTTQAWFGLRTRVAETAARRGAAPAPDGASERARMRVLGDVELVLTAEIGRTRLPMRQVLDLVPGTVLELDRAAGAPADVMVNGRLVARGDVVVVDEDYGIRITEIIAAEANQ